jgi:hypothetical protein
MTAAMPEGRMAAYAKVPARMHVGSNFELGSDRSVVERTRPSPTGLEVMTFA